MASGVFCLDSQARAFLHSHFRSIFVQNRALGRKNWVWTWLQFIYILTCTHIMDDRTPYAGRSRTIEWAVLPDGKMPGLEAWVQLPKAQRAKLWTTIRRLGDTGECRNKERFRHERGKIYAIKTPGTRVYCFMTSDRRIILTNVITKRQQKARKEDLERAERIKSEFENVKGETT